MKESLLKIQNVAFRPPGQDKVILSDINYEIFKSNFIIILGSNGSGKSTLLKLIEKRIFPSEGNILLENKNINTYSKKIYSDKIKTLTQNCDDSLFSSLTILENYRLVQKNIFIKQEKEFLQDYLSPFNPNLGQKLNQVVAELSGGEKQSLALAFTILNPPSLLLLDEHTSALDPKTAQANMKLTYDMILKHNITCVLTTHNLNIAMEYGNRILVIRDGKIANKIEKEEKQKFTEETMLKSFYTST